MRRTATALAILSAAALGLAGCGSPEVKEVEEPPVEEVVVEQSAGQVEQSDNASDDATEKPEKGGRLTREEACAALEGDSDNVAMADLDLEELNEQLAQATAEGGDYEALITKAKGSVKQLNNDEVAGQLIKVLDAQGSAIAAMEQAFDTGDFDSPEIEERTAQFDAALDGLLAMCPNLGDLN